MWSFLYVLHSSSRLAYFPTMVFWANTFCGSSLKVILVEIFNYALSTEEVDIHLCAKCKELFSSKVCASLKEDNNFPDIVSFDHQQNFLKIHPITRAGVIHVVLISFPKLPKQDISTALNTLCTVTRYSGSHLNICAL